MNRQPVIAKVPREAIRFIPARLVAGPAAEVPGAPTDKNGQQMALGIAHVALEGEPIVAVTVVLGSVQISLSFDPDELDKFCHLLADGALWQNEQLRQKAGQMVH